jgi:hypothetical protein
MSQSGRPLTFAVLVLPVPCRLRGSFAIPLQTSQCPISRVKRTSLSRVSTSANDPKRPFRPIPLPL